MSGQPLPVGRVLATTSKSRPPVLGESRTRSRSVTAVVVPPPKRAAAVVVPPPRRAAVVVAPPTEPKEAASTAPVPPPQAVQVPPVARAVPALPARVSPAPVTPPKAVQVPHVSRLLPAEPDHPPLRHTTIYTCGENTDIGDFGPCVIVDLRRFHDPSTRNDLNLRGHIGWNPTMMVQLLMNASFRQIIGRALTLGLREHECDFVFKCMAGRHRSVCAATCCGIILKIMLEMAMYRNVTLRAGAGVVARARDCAESVVLTCRPMSILLCVTFRMHCHIWRKCQKFHSCESRTAGHAYEGGKDAVLKLPDIAS